MEGHTFGLLENGFRLEYFRGRGSKHAKTNFLEAHFSLISWRAKKTIHYKYAFWRR